MNLQPLSDIERRFAEENHDLVCSFLKKKRLPKSQYYDVVIFGYLRAVQEYIGSERLKRFAFSTLAWKRMQSALFNYRQYLTRQKRTAHTVSLDAKIGKPDGLTWNEIVADMDERMLTFEIRLVLHDLAKMLPAKNMRIIYMRLDGAKMHEIAKREHMTFHEIKMMLDESRKAFSRLYF